MSKTHANTKVAAPDSNFGQSGNFVRENQKSLLFIGGAIIALIAIYLLYLKLYLGPREITAADQMHVAQDFWAKKDWDKAINGDASYPGFASLAIPLFAFGGKRVFGKSNKIRKTL